MACINYFISLQIGRASYRYAFVICITSVQFSAKSQYCMCAVFHGIFQMVILLRVLFKYSVFICKIILLKIKDGPLLKSNIKPKIKLYSNTEDS